MPSQSISSFEGINTFSNPFNTSDGNVIHCVNLDAFPAGQEQKDQDILHLTQRAEIR